MRAISTGSTFKIFDDTLRSYEKLPVQTYVVRFDRQTGFYLEKYVDITIPEEKIYGVHIALGRAQSKNDGIHVGLDGEGLVHFTRLDMPIHG